MPEEVSQVYRDTNLETIAQVLHQGQAIGKGKVMKDQVYPVFIPVWDSQTYRAGAIGLGWVSVGGFSGWKSRGSGSSVGVFLLCDFTKRVTSARQALHTCACLIRRFSELPLQDGFNPKP